MTTFRRSPWYVRMANGLLSLAPTSKLDKDALIHQARRRTGLRDLGEGMWEEALGRLLVSIKEEARLSPLGRIMVREQILGRLEQRLLAENWFRRHPEILEQELWPVWLITGLQRTGTTRLQRLLGADPDARSLLSWEAMFPAPLAKNWPQKDNRIAKTRRAARALRLIKPGFYAIHPIEPLLPEEDVLLLDISFMSTSWEAMLHVPSFAYWLKNTDPTPAYAYEVKLLKLLQWQDRIRAGDKPYPITKPTPSRLNPHHTLKSPHHLEWLEIVHKVFPEVKFIWTHRDERECIPSFLSMLAHGRAMFSYEVNLEEIKAHWLNKNRVIMGKAKRFRKQFQPVAIHDVAFAEMMENPLRELKRLYTAFGAECPVGTMLEALKEEGRGRVSANHVYSPGDFGL